MTGDSDNWRFYWRADREYGETVLRKIVAEIKTGEDKTFRGSPAKLFTVKLRQWCEGQGVEPFFGRARPQR